MWEVGIAAGMIARDQVAGHHASTILIRMLDLRYSSHRLAFYGCFLRVIFFFLFSFSSCCREHGKFAPQFSLMPTYAVRKRGF